MKVYGVDIEELAPIALEKLPRSGDDSLDILIYLAGAYAIANKMKEKGAVMSLNRRPLVIPYLVRAFRDLLYIRPRLPQTEIDETILSRFGRLLSHENESDRKNSSRVG